jgi:HSP20 family molecular chaperone IbpA
MTLNRWNPWTDLFSMHDQLYNDALGRSMMSERTIHTLPIDIRQSDDAFEIEASVPGFKPADIEITFDENVLTIRGAPPGGRDHARHLRQARAEPPLGVPAGRPPC